MSHTLENIDCNTLTNILSYLPIKSRNDLRLVNKSLKQNISRTSLDKVLINVTKISLLTFFSVPLHYFYETTKYPRTISNIVFKGEKTFKFILLNDNGIKSIQFENGVTNLYLPTHPDEWIDVLYGLTKYLDWNYIVEYETQWIYGNNYNEDRDEIYYSSNKFLSFLETIMHSFLIMNVYSNSIEYYHKNQNLALFIKDNTLTNKYLVLKLIHRYLSEF